MFLYFYFYLFSMYHLTQEAKQYLEKGLPEKKLIELLEEPLSIDEAKSKVENFSIALGWAKRNNWIKIEHNKIILIKKPEQYEQEQALKDLASGKNIKQDLIKILFSRKLIEEVKETELIRARKQTKEKIITNLTTELIKTGLWRDVQFKPYNVEVVGKEIYLGKRQPYNRFLFEVRQKLVELGFKEMKGPIIETEFWNFDALYQPQNHPARDWTDTYQLKYPKQGNLPNKNLVERVKSAHENGWKTGGIGWGYKWNSEKAAKLMPRAHGTCLSARYLAKGIEIPGKYFAIARCFRPDVIDATHAVEFNQIEGIVVDPSLTFRSLLGILKMFATEIAGTDKIKFYSDYYPFTEPSVQLSAKHPKLGWVEFGGAGIFREELTKPLGADVPVIAWGLGIDRLAMFKLGIKDIRYLFTQDLKWLREKGVF